MSPAWPVHFRSLLLILAPMHSISGATLTGIVADAAGKPVQDARIDHAGRLVVIPPSSASIGTAPDEVRTDAAGRFRLVTDVPAVVIRKPGYESERVRINGDMELKISLTPIRSKSRCRLSKVPAFETQQANDIDYAATWFYIKTKQGWKGIISGTGPFYSWGAPRDNDVWTSVEYEEIMYDSGIIDASGHSSDGKYWRFRGMFGAAAQYYGQTREAAQQLDCVMDRVPIESR